MRQDKLSKIEAKVKLGMPLTKKEKAIYLIYSNALDLGVVNEAINI